ncbi:hypothetical protein F5878DRAFT_603367 [Lentinula raphanica]|uniref:DUF7918 domain-containing protein n=1 Tax=Lentinula raphanica TaxID=153919 RepID=A0AA38PJ57_9AGAR|nr:hypothetical protein F5878DRAFT_603367 [Lentinula raphanica]
MPLAFEDFTAWIEVEGSELPLFDVKVNGREVSCWIPSEAGKNFIVKCATGKRGSSICGDVYMDGKLFMGIAMPAGVPQTFTFSGVLTSATTQQPFVFTNLVLTDDDHYLNEASAGLGDIKLVLSHVTLGGWSSQATYAKCNTISKIHEKSKKATGHKVDLGDEQSIPHTSKLNATRHDVIVNFVFKYRPLDMLRANGIAPPAPCTSTSTKRSKSAVKTEVLDLTIDAASEDDEDTRRMRSLEEELEQIRRRKRRKTQHIKTEPTVKPEPGTSSSRDRNRHTSDDVIDLT